MTVQGSGKTTNWLAVAVGGRCVGSFGDNEQAARDFIDERAKRGVTLRLFCQETTMTEVEHP